MKLELNVYVYAYNKFHKKNWLGPDNRKLAGVSNFPIDPREILVGGVVIELNKNFKKKIRVSFLNQDFKFTLIILCTLNLGGKK